MDFGQDDYYSEREYIITVWESSQLQYHIIKTCFPDKGIIRVFDDKKILNPCCLNKRQLLKKDKSIRLNPAAPIK